MIYKTYIYVFFLVRRNIKNHSLISQVSGNNEIHLQKFFIMQIISRSKIALAKNN